LLTRVPKNAKEEAGTCRAGRLPERKRIILEVHSRKKNLGRRKKSRGGFGRGNTIDGFGPNEKTNREGFAH